jgi:hypothetical protein
MVQLTTYAKGPHVGVLSPLRIAVTKCHGKPDMAGGAVTKWHGKPTWQVAQ